MDKIVISDLHFGNKNHSEDFNKDMLKFMMWMVDWKNKQDAEYELVITGDVFQQRDKLSISTLHYSYKAMVFLAKNFPKVTILVGNHDMFYRDKREVNSLIIFRDIPNVEIIEEPKIDGNEMYVPWLITGEEYDNVVNLSKKHKIDRIFGHFEFSTFRMNDHYVMEHGQTHKSLKHVGLVITGHYHMRQEVDNIVYVGTPFPYDFNDANDEKRGFMVVTDNGYHFVNYNSVKVLSMDYKEFIAKGHEFDDSTTIRVVITEELSEKDMDDLKDKMISAGVRDSRIQYKLDKSEITVDNPSELDIDVTSPDALVVDMLMNMEDETYDKTVLVSLYKKLITD